MLKFASFASSEKSKIFKYVGWGGDSLNVCMLGGEGTSKLFKSVQGSLKSLIIESV